MSVVRFFRNMPGAWVAQCLLVSAFACSSAHGGAAESLEASLRKRGFECGYNDSSGCYVFVGISEHEIDASAVRSLDALRRNVWCLEAELNARKSLVKGLMTEFRASGGTKSANESGGDARASHSESEHVAQRVLLGCTTVGSEEVYDDGRYQIAVAVKWSRKDERNAIESFLDGTRGEVDPGVWTNWLSRTGVAVLPSTWSFGCADGMIRHVGIGCADVEGVEDTSLFMKRAKKTALAWARANLSLALCSDFSSLDKVTTDLFERNEPGTASRQLEERLFSLATRVSGKLTSFAPEVYSTFAVHPITGRKMYVSVCGYEPWELAELGIIDRRALRNEDDVSAQNPATENPGVMIWNPNTGKYEKR